jgi:hypothetical protein
VNGTITDDNGIALECERDRKRKNARNVADKNGRFSIKANQKDIQYFRW